MVADIGFHAHSRFRCPVRRIRVQTAVQRDSSRCTAVTLFFPIRRLWHTSLPPLHKCRGGQAYGLYGDKETVHFKLVTRKYRFSWF